MRGDTCLTSLLLQVLRLTTTCWAQGSSTGQYVQTAPVLASALSTAVSRRSTSGVENSTSRDLWPAVSQLAWCLAMTANAAEPHCITAVSVHPHHPNTPCWLRCCLKRLHVLLLLPLHICPLRYVYQETLGRWSALDLFFGLAFLARRDSERYPAADIAATGTPLAPSSRVEARRLLAELRKVRRYMVYCQGLRHRTAEQQQRHWADALGTGGHSTGGLQRPLAIHKATACQFAILQQLHGERGEHGDACTSGVLLMQGVAW